MDILRVTALWSGFVGAPGYSVFHFAGGGGLISDAQQVANRVASAFSEITAQLPSDVTIEVQSEVEELNADTGIVTGYQSIDPPDIVSGTDGGDYAAPVGAVVNWTTDDLRFGRRIRGRTFLVPLSGDSFGTNGRLSTSADTALEAFGDTMRGFDLDSEFVVWSRPRDGSGGVAATVTGSNVPPLAAVLRSRRD